MKAGRPDPFDDPLRYLSRRWRRWPSSGGPSYLDRLIQAAWDYVDRRNVMVPVVDASIRLRSHRATPQGRASRRRPGRPPGGVGVEAAFARAMSRWATLNLPELPQPAEILALAVVVGIQSVPPPLESESRARGRRDQRDVCKARWRVLCRVASRRAAESPVSAPTADELEWAHDSLPELPKAKPSKSRRSR
jgi:hypothetical protein